MKNLVSVSALYLLFLNFILLLLIYFSLSFPVVFKHHNNLFLTTYDFIAVVKSSRVAAFFIFNVTVIAVFFGSFRPFQNYDPCYLPVSTRSNYQALDDHGYVKDQEANYQHDNSGGDDDDYSTDQDDLYGGILSDGYDEDNDDDGGDSSDDSLFGDGEDYDYDDDDDDEEKFIDLQRRSEEFIAKNNKRWIEELRNERILCIAAATEIILTSSSS